MNMAIAGVDVENEEDFEDILNKTIEGRKMVKNANYYAFTATPKNKTLEMFGKKIPQPDGKPKFEPHHNYTMRQAIQEGFIIRRTRVITRSLNRKSSASENKIPNLTATRRKRKSAGMWKVAPKRLRKKPPSL